jgi:hypothetical protein
MLLLSVCCRWLTCFLKSQDAGVETISMPFTFDPTLEEAKFLSSYQKYYSEKRTEQVTIAVEKMDTNYSCYYNLFIIIIIIIIIIMKNSKT